MHRLLVIFLTLTASVSIAAAQDLYIFAEDEYPVRSVRFSGNESFSDGALHNVVEVEKSPSGFVSWLNRRVSSKIGRPPVYFDVYQVGEDLERISAFYEGHGFFEVAVDTSLSVDAGRNRVRVTFTIDEGRRWTIGEIVYGGIAGVDSTAAALIGTGADIAMGMPYQIDRVEREYQRVLDILHNNGYAKAAIGNVNVRYSMSEPVAHISMEFDPGERFSFGDVRVNLEEDRGYHVSPRIIHRMLEYEEGETYSLAKRSRSERNLNRLGIFESAKIDIRIPTADDTSRVIPSVVNIRPRTKHEITPEILVNDENNAFNIGMGVGYANRNFMGGARILTLRSRVRVQSIQELQLVRVLNENGWSDPSLLGGIDLSAEVTQPYIISTQTSGRWGVSYVLEKFPSIQYSLLRNRIGVNHQFTTTTYGFLEWTLERVSQKEIGGGLTAEERAQLPSSQRFEPQLNSVLAFTLQRDRTDDVFSPSRGFFHSGTIEEGGLLPVVFSYLGEQLPYAQYVKATFTGRWYFPIDARRNHIIGIKLQSGYATLYARGNDTPLPIHRRFYAGGSGSVRGWKSRQLGMMERPDFGGNAIVEGNIESRMNILRNLGTIPIDFERLWGVVFLDFGNVWQRGSDIRPQDVALATGFGLRYNTLIGPLRVDFGFRLYDPKAAPGRQWMFDRPPLRDLTIHFGIGHAF
jgi:outer membrane protein insertion porin family